MSIHDPQLTAHSSRNGLTLYASMLIASFGATSLLAQNQARVIHSTHDWRSDQVNPQNGTEVWTDVKSPGDGQVYSVGSLSVPEVLSSTIAGYVSLVGVEKSPVGWFAISPGGNRQVALVQATDATQTILWQRYFYGHTALTTQGSRDTIARAISVWPNSSPALARVAICGETFDNELPLSQLGGAGPTGYVASGYVAVYDGNGLFLWSHQFFGGGEATGHCAITDLSIRVEQVGTVTYDVVTYCGISSYGLVASGPLAPVAPFTNIASAGSYQPGLGNSPLPGAQWDGFVGRIRHNRATATTNSPADFHSNVGGNDQDGLFAIAEIDQNTFVVTGSTRKPDSTGTSTYAFPFTSAYNFSSYPGFVTSWNTADNFSVGVFMAFDASSLGTGLSVIDALWLGSVTNGEETYRWTVGHDVVATPYTGSYYVVGTTGDSNFLPATATPFTANVAHGSKTILTAGDCDGFVVFREAYPVSSVTTVGLFGSNKLDGICGVSRWNEHFSSAAFCGWEQDPIGGGSDIRCGSLAQGGRGLTTSGLPGEPVRQLGIAVASAELPAALGAPNAQNSGGSSPTPPQYLLDEPAGGRSHGGIAVDHEGRATIVGYTFGSGYPYLAVPGSGFLDGRGPSATPFTVDAVRTVVDMLPLGISRTEGTGTYGNGTAPRQATAPYTGGTTPVGACQAPFGFQIGAPTLPPVSRLHIDYLGAAPAAGGPARHISIDGYFPVGTWNVAAIQFGFPGPSNNYIPYSPPGSTVELWSVNSPSYLPTSGSGGSYTEFQLPVFPPGPLTLTVQGIWFLAAPLACDPAGIIASPGLVINYL